VGSLLDIGLLNEYEYADWLVNANSIE